MIEGLVERFRALQDPRCPGRIAHPLVGVLVIAVCAVVVGAETFEDVALYGRCKEAWLRSFLELPGGVPSHDAFRRVLMLVDPPLLTLASLYRGHRGTLGLEQLFHEQSHVMMDSVTAVLAAAGADPGSSETREVEHWIIFYTTGELARRVVPGHTPYAEWRGLWRLGGFAPGRAALVASWQPYLDGALPFRDAVTRLARAWAADEPTARP